jgi:hypothetical protein
MRRPKLITVRSGADIITHLFASRDNANSVRIDVTEVESGPNAGMLVVELRDIKGNVQQFTPDTGKSPLEKRAEALESVIVQAIDILKDGDYREAKQAMDRVWSLLQAAIG